AECLRFSVPGYCELRAKETPPLAPRPAADRPIRTGQSTRSSVSLVGIVRDVAARALFLLHASLARPVGFDLRGPRAAGARGRNHSRRRTEPGHRSLDGRPAE